VLGAAASLVEEVQVAAEATGIRLAPYGALGLAAFRGRDAEASALASATKEEAAVRGEGAGISVADWRARSSATVLAATTVRWPGPNKPAPTPRR